MLGALAGPPPFSSILLQDSHFVIIFVTIKNETSSKTLCCTIILDLLVEK